MPGPNPVKLCVLGLVIIALASFWFAVLEVYEREANHQTRQFSLQGAKGSGHVTVDARFISFDPQRGDLLVRLMFDAGGDLDAGGLLQEDITVFVNAAAGRTSTTFKKGETMSGVEVTLALTDSTPGEFPYDHHEGVLQIVTGHPTKDGMEPVALVVRAEASIPGFEADVSEVRSTETSHATAFLKIALQRTGSVRFFANFIMTLMWLILLSAASVVIATIVDGRVPELTFFQWLAALLFALPPLRNAMAGAPPIGARCDYLSFFWAEGGVALSMLTLVVVWLARRGRSA